MAVPGIPDGYLGACPYLIVADGWAEVRFLREAFGAKVEFLMAAGEPGKEEAAGGAIHHAQLEMLGGKVMLSTAQGMWSPMQSSNHVYVTDVDAVYAAAMQAGAVSLYEPRNEFYGDRAAGVKDPAGNMWWLATRKEELSVEEIRRRAMGK